MAALLILILLAGEPLAELKDTQKFRTPGRAVKLESGTLHLFIGGQHSTMPTVVIDGDLGLPALAWAQLVQELSQKTLVVAWDRPGYGWSMLGSQPHDGLSLMKQLHQALSAQEQMGPFAQSLGLPPPYLLVGQGLGTAHMRIFANEYPDDVSGMVLVDCLYPGPGADLLKGRQDQLSTEAWKRRLLLRRLSPEDPPAWLSDVPADLRGGAEAMLGRFDTAKAESEEVASLDETLRQAEQLRSFGDKPLRVLRTQIPNDPDLARRLRLDAELARLSTRGDLQVIPPGPATHAAGSLGQVPPVLQAIHTALGIPD
ncbi:MAG TPA: alpha/beta fold hydrolase [Holophagaceae bacterium]|nr:alpha/beta fold hydrolase [Holophagaceae bacterium]